MPTESGWPFASPIVQKIGPELSPLQAEFSLDGDLSDSKSWLGLSLSKPQIIRLIIQLFEKQVGIIQLRPQESFQPREGFEAKPTFPLT